MHPFSNLSSKMVSSMMMVVMLQMLLLQTAVSQVGVSVDPAQIGVTSPSLDVGCTFSLGESSMAAVITISLFRENNTYLGSVTSISGHHANVISSEEITGDGYINPEGQSFLNLHWDYPEDTQAGTYRCVAKGIDALGNIIESVNTSEVSSAYQPELQGLLNELNQMRQEMKQMQAYIDQLEAKMENQLDLSSVFLLPPLSYNSKRYFVSKAPFQDFNESITICKAYGGILAEINDRDEYLAVQNYMENVTDVSRVFIGGTDEGHDGTWVLPSSYQILPYTDWWGTQPYRGETQNCLLLYIALGWRMYSDHCHYNTVRLNYKYMCEV